MACVRIVLSSASVAVVMAFPWFFLVEYLLYVGSCFISPYVFLCLNSRASESPEGSQIQYLHYELQYGTHGAAVS